MDDQTLCRFRVNRLITGCNTNCGMIKSLTTGKVLVRIETLTTVGHVMSLMHKLYPFIDTPFVVFDFTGISYAKSIATAVFARELREVLLYRNERRLITKANIQIKTDVTCRYLDHMGFFDFIGVQHKGDLKTVRHRLEQQIEGRIPIIEYGYLYFQRGTGYDPMDGIITYDQAEGSASDIIETESVKIVEALLGKISGNEVLAYCVRELLRNCYEHSRADKYYVFGQTWNNGKSELVIMDYGNGLLKTLKKKYPELLDEQSAIIKAAEPGVSEADFTGKNRYENSGFGLYVLCQLAKRFGSLYIASNGTMVEYGKDGSVFKMRSKGTMVALQFRRMPDDFGATLGEIIEEGRKVAKTGQYPISPSLLTKQYIKNGTNRIVENKPSTVNQ